MLTDFLIGAIAVAVFALPVAWVMPISGVSDRASSTWPLFGLAGIFLLFGFVQHNAMLLGAGTGGIVAMSAFVWRAARRSESADTAAMSLADELGLRYEQESSSPQLRDLASALTMSAEVTNKVHRVLSGRWHGNGVTLFDYYWEMDVPRGGTQRRNYTSALVAVSRDNEPVTVTAETFLTRVVAKLGSPDLELGDAPFDRLFKVRSKDPTAAREILGPQARAWLTENGRGFSFLVGRGAVLCMAKEGAATRADLLELVSKFQPQVSKAADAGAAEMEIDRFAPAQVR